MLYPIPENFKRTILDGYGSSGEAWLERLPRFLAEVEARWSIRLGPPFELSYNYVAPALRSDGVEVVLKVGHPNRELTSEMTALQHYAGRGIERLLEADPAQGAMLQERLRPGAELAGVNDDDAATRIAARVMRDLWIPAPDDPQGLLCRADLWARGLERLRREFNGGTGPYPTRLVEQAEALFTELIASAGPMALLHGDLHHRNILSAERQPWLALDPKGLIGEREYEIGSLLRNRWPENATKADLRRQADRRLAILSEELGLSRERMLAWSMAQAVLSAWWTYEDHHRVETRMITLAEALSELIG